MSATVGEPFVLSSYPLPPTSKKTSKKKTSKDHAVLPVYTGYCEVPRAQVGQVALAVQAAGVHILDLKGLHLVTSYTLGPSTTFACAPVSFIAEGGTSLTRKTYAVIQSAPDVSEDDSAQTVWCWKEILGGGVSTSSGEKQIFRSSHKISEMIHLPRKSPTIALFSSGCELTLIDENCVEKLVWSSPHKQTIVKRFAFRRSACAFGHASSLSKADVLLLQFARRDKVMHLQILLMSNTVSVLELGRIPVDHQDIVKVSCNESGFCTLLSSNGTWSSFRLLDDDNSLKISSIGQPMSLQNLTLTPTSSKSISSVERPPISILSLGSSHVLLAGITTSSSPEIAILLWDVQYSVLLSSSSLPVPASLSNLTPPDLSLVLSYSGPNQALLVLSPLPSSAQRGSAKATSSLYAIPFSVPPTSTIANAIGKAKSGLQWLQPKSPAQNDVINVSTSGSDAEADGFTRLRRDREELLSNIRTALAQNRPEAADTLFFAWVDAESKRIKKVKTKLLFTENEEAKQDEMEVEQEEKAGDEDQAVSGSANPDQKKNQKIEVHTLKISHGPLFVSSLLEILFPATATASHSGSSPALTLASASASVSATTTAAPYSSKILHYLVDRQLVLNSMVQGGLLSVLHSRSDWMSILLVLHKVIDIPESDIVRLLRIIVDSQSSQAQPEAQSQSPPSLPAFLAACISYRSTPTPLRLAIRTHFSTAEPLTSLLAILSRWLEEWSSRDLNLGIGSGLAELSLEANAETHVVAKANRKMRSRMRKKAEEIPELEDILVFLQALLDSSFLTLLRHKPAHVHLRSIVGTIDPQLTLGAEIDRLRPVLEPFSRMHNKHLAEASEEHRAGGGTGGVDWRKRRKQAREQAELAVGLYQVEELVF